MSRRRRREARQDSAIGTPYAAGEEMEMTPKTPKEPELPLRAAHVNRRFVFVLDETHARGGHLELRVLGDLESRVYSADSTASQSARIVALLDRLATGMAV